MAVSKLYNLARMTTATTGAGTITLGSAVSGFLSFTASGISDGDVVSYAISDGSNSECGTGTYTASGTTLTRTVDHSTNANSAISLSGSAQVFITALQGNFPVVDRASGNTVLYGGVATGSTLTLASTNNGSPSGDTVTIKQGGNALVTLASGLTGFGTVTPQSQVHINANAATVANIIPGSAILQLTAANSNYAGIQIDTFGVGTSFFPVLFVRNARGTAASPTATQVSDFLFSFAGYGYNSGYQESVALTFQSTENWSSGHQGTNIVFTTTAVGTATSAAALTIGAGLSVGNSTDPGAGSIFANTAIGIGTNAIAAAVLALTAGTTAKSQINFGSSTAPTSPNNGDFWFDGTNFKARVSGTTKTFTIT